MPVTIKSDGTVDSTRVYDEAGREVGVIERLEIIVDAKNDTVRAVLTLENPKFELTDGSVVKIKPTTKGKSK
jgi:hypothetical protein